jgi:hypothetical protein
MTERQQTLLRILNLMQQGIVTPEEAADLIDALYEVAPSAAQPESEASQSNGNGSANPARGLFDQILRAVEETMRATGQAVRSVNWQQIGQSVREQTQRGTRRTAPNARRAGKRRLVLGTVGQVRDRLAASDGLRD